MKDTESVRTGHSRTERFWLGTVLAMVALMVVIGGITRLTRSGLSIVEWRPVTGILPPLSQADWEEAFAAYRATPEYRLVNRHFDLAAFQSIYFWEYLHRLWGRLIGFAVFFPGLFLFLRNLSAGRRDFDLLRTWLFLLVFGGLQGFLGWFMVQSGLVNEPRVSHYRLAAHLVLALMLEAYILWKILRSGAKGSAQKPGRATAPGGDETAPARLRHATILLGLVLGLQILYGAFTAGLRAGYMHNTFPDMSGALLPPGILAMEPAPLNLLENRVTIQFVHRTLGWFLLFGATGLAIGARGRGARFAAGANLFAASVWIQFILGAATILTAVPVWLGVAHQAGALLAFNAYVLLLYRTLRG